jgi:putative PIN family toxin of toxin-antitoxin system
MIAVFDTNTVISSFFWNGAPAQLLSLARGGACQVASCDTQFKELFDVLERPYFEKRRAALGISSAAMVKGFAKFALRVTPTSLSQPVCRDPKDDFVLACALTAQASMVVSGDNDLLVLKIFEGIPIVTAAQALKIFD